MNNTHNIESLNARLIRLERSSKRWRLAAIVSATILTAATLGGASAREAEKTEERSPVVAMTSHGGKLYRISADGKLSFYYPKVGWAEAE